GNQGQDQQVGSLPDLTAEARSVCERDVQRVRASDQGTLKVARGAGGSAPAPRSELTSLRSCRGSTERSRSSRARVAGSAGSTLSHSPAPARRSWSTTSVRRWRVREPTPVPRTT